MSLAYPFSGASALFPGRTRLFLLLALFGLMVTGCGSSSSSPSTPTATARSVTQPQASGKKSIRVVSSTVPQAISLKGRTGVMTITVKVTGVALDVQALGGAPKDAQGHIQAYLDSIPAGAYRKTDFTFPWLFQVASALITFRLPPAVLHAKPGPHRIILALAKNNGVLYRVPTVSLGFVLGS